MKEKGTCPYAFEGNDTMTYGDEHYKIFQQDIADGKYVSPHVRKMSESFYMEDSNPPAVQAMIDKSKSLQDMSEEIMRAEQVTGLSYYDWHNDPQHNIEPTIKQDEESRQRRLDEDAWDIDFSPLYKK